MFCATLRNRRCRLASNFLVLCSALCPGGGAVARRKLHPLFNLPDHAGFLLRACVPYE
nr:MAG TPA: hypothetical protein [Caudoviricetes sp.]